MAEPLLSDPPSPRRRWSAGDGIRLLLGGSFFVVGLMAATIAEGTISGAEEDLVKAFSRLPDRLEQALVGVAQLIAGLVPLAILGIMVWRRNWRLILGAWLAGNLAAVATLAVESWLGERDSSVVLAERTISSAWLTDPNFPSTPYLASAAAVVTIGVPWFSRRWKRALWAWILLLVVLRVLGSGEPALDVALAVAVGVVIGSLGLIVFGSPNPEPGPHELLDGLRAVGIEPSAIRRAAEAEGESLFLLDEPGIPTRFVKLRTPDDQSSDLLNRLSRAIRLRSSEVERPYNTLKRRVEHEALLLREAEIAGAACPALIALGTTEGGSVFLVLEFIDGEPASSLDADELTDEILDDLWRQVGALHRARLAHHALSLDNVLVDRTTERVSVIDWDAAESVAAPRNRARDVAELLVDLSLVVGTARAVESALRSLGPEPVAASLPLLQPLALTGAVRQRLGRGTGLLEELRAEVRDDTHTDDIPLERLERVSPRTIVMTVAASLAFYSLLPQLANVDDTIDAFGDADLAWIPAVLVASAVSYVFATISFLGSVAQPLPIGPSVRVTIASSFAALVGPAATGKMALAVRFLQRAGIDTTAASASVGLNSIAGVVTHLVLMFSFFAWTGSAGVGGFSLPDADTVMVVLAVAVAVIAVAMLLGPIRRRVVGPFARVVREASTYIASVFRSPVRVLALLGGSSLITLSYTAALIFSVQAFGGGLSVPQIGAAYLGAAAIANIAPTPGGLGALEAAMIAALTGFGLPSGPAVSAVLTFRLATFWLPILPGWLTMAWMQRREEI